MCSTRLTGARCGFPEEECQTVRRWFSINVVRYDCWWLARSCCFVRDSLRPLWGFISTELASVIYCCCYSICLLLLSVFKLWLWLSERLQHLITELNGAVFFFIRKVDDVELRGTPRTSFSVLQQTLNLWNHFNVRVFNSMWHPHFSGLSISSARVGKYKNLCMSYFWGHSVTSCNCWLMDGW